MVDVMTFGALEGKPAGTRKEEKERVLLEMKEDNKTKLEKKEVKKTTEKIVPKKEEKVEKVPVAKLQEK